jgi:putative toxin-antitoxin system antitoxin component (TIGR02293 family)
MNTTLAPKSHRAKARQLSRKKPLKTAVKHGKAFAAPVVHPAHQSRRPKGIGALALSALPAPYADVETDRFAGAVPRAAAPVPNGMLNETLERIKKGIPLTEFAQLTTRLGLTQEEFAKKIGISVPTLFRRKRAASPLDPDHSDRLMRFQRLLNKAIELFDGDEAAARDWLNRSEPALGYQKPLDVAETEAGAREVEIILGRLEYGELT